MFTKTDTPPAPGLDVLDALQWMIEQAAAAFTENLAGLGTGVTAYADMVCANESRTMRDFVAVMAWAEAVGMADVHEIDGALPNEGIRAALLAYQPSDDAQPVCSDASGHLWTCDDSHGAREYCATCGAMGDE